MHLKKKKAAKQDYRHSFEFGNRSGCDGVFICNVTCVCVMYIFPLTGSQLERLSPVEEFLDL